MGFPETNYCAVPECNKQAMPDYEFCREHMLYHIALKEGKRRFGSPCRHEEVKNGHCTRCLRKVI